MDTDGSSPLSGRRVLVPRAAHQASALSDRIRAAGGSPVEAPTIVTVPGDVAALRQAVAELRQGRFVALCLTSPNGVRALADVAGPTVELGGAAVWAVGPKTAAALHDRLGLTADLVPREATSAALAAAIPPGAGAVLAPRGDLATDELPTGLRARGYDPVEVVAYRTGRPAALDPAIRADLLTGRIDLVACTSASTVRNLVALVGDRLGAQVVTIGPVTSAACRELGLPVAAEADPHDLDGLVAALGRAAAG